MFVLSCLAYFTEHDILGVLCVVVCYRIPSIKGRILVHTSPIPWAAAMWQPLWLMLLRMWLCVSSFPHAYRTLLVVTLEVVSTIVWGFGMRSRPDEPLESTPLTEETSTDLQKLPVSSSRPLESSQKPPQHAWSLSSSCMFARLWKLLGTLRHLGQRCWVVLWTQFKHSLQCPFFYLSPRQWCFGAERAKGKILNGKGN